MEESITRGPRRENPFAQIDRQLINDTRLNFDVRGMLVYLIDKPAGWQTSIPALVKQSPAGRFSVRRMISEAEKFGYIKRHITRESGKFKTRYEVFETPEEQFANDSPGTVSRRGKTDAGKPTRENRRGKTDAGNRTYSNTHVSNTHVSNTDQRDTEVSNTQAVDDDDRPITHHVGYSKGGVGGAHLAAYAEDDLRHIAFECGSLLSLHMDWTGFDAYLNDCDSSELISLIEWIHHYSEQPNENIDKIHSLPGILRSHIRTGQRAQLTTQSRANLLATANRIITQSDPDEDETASTIDF